jgi:hypothetical protein
VGVFQEGTPINKCPIYPSVQPYNRHQMEIKLYVYKLPVVDGRPPRRWLTKARWYLLKTEKTPRFKSILATIEAYKIPAVVLDPRELLVVKCDVVNDLLVAMAPDLMHDTILTDEEIKSLETNEYWSVERVKLDKRGIALWKLGLRTKTGDKIRVVREMFKTILEDMEETKGVKS